MSAEPARPGPEGLPTASAPVLYLQAARPRRRPRSERIRVPDQPTGDLTPHERLAATLEGVFARQGRTLTDDGTVTDFLITLGEVRRLLAGALAQGLLDETQHGTLDGMLEGMEAAPGLIGGTQF